MGAYGTFEIAEAVHVSIGNDDVDLPAGRFEPTTDAEAQACRHLCGVTRQAPGDTTSHVMATLVEEPAPEAGEAQDLAAAQAEVAKAEADLAAAEAAKPAAPAAPAAAAPAAAPASDTPPAAPAAQ